MQHAHNTCVCNSVALQGLTEISPFCCALYKHKDNSCSEEFVFDLGLKRKILRKEKLLLEIKKLNPVLFIAYCCPPLFVV